MIATDKTTGIGNFKPCKTEKSQGILQTRVLLHLSNVSPLKIFAVLVENTFHMSFSSDAHSLLF